MSGQTSQSYLVVDQNCHYQLYTVVWVLDYNRPNIHHLTTLYLLSYISLYIVSVMVTMISFSYSLVLDTVLESRLFAFVKLSLIHSLRFHLYLRSWWHAAQLIKISQT